MPGLVHALCLLPAAALWWLGGAWAWRRARRDAESALRQAAPGTARPAGPLPPPEALPEPVARYLQRAAPPGTPTPATVWLRQRGRLCSDAEHPRWMDFDAEHRVAPGACAFDWLARVRVLPGLWLSVRDRLAAGRGSGQVRVMGWLEIAADGGHEAMNLGSLHRFLAEAVWYPQALRPGDHLHWRAIDARRALATLRVGALSVSLEFRFNEAGEVSGIHTPARWGAFDGGYAQRGWEGHFSDWAELGGSWVPRRGEVGWFSPQGHWAPVWQGEVLERRAEPPRPG